MLKPYYLWVRKDYREEERQSEKKTGKDSFRIYSMNIYIQTNNRLKTDAEYIHSIGI